MSAPYDLQRLDNLLLPDVAGADDGGMGGMQVPQAAAQGNAAVISVVSQPQPVSLPCEYGRPDELATAHGDYAAMCAPPTTTHIPYPGFGFATHTLAQQPAPALAGVTLMPAQSSPQAQECALTPHAAAALGHYGLSVPAASASAQQHKDCGDPTVHGRVGGMGLGAGAALKMPTDIGGSTHGASQFTQLTTTSMRSGETFGTHDTENTGPEVDAPMPRAPTDEKERAKQLAALQSLFVYRLKEAAARLGVGTTSLKRLCRSHGIKRWPHRKVFSVARCVEQLRTATGCTSGDDAAAITVAVASRGASMHARASSVPPLGAPNSSGNPLAGGGLDNPDLHQQHASVGRSMRGENLFQQLYTTKSNAANMCPSGNGGSNEKTPAVATGAAPTVPRDDDESLPRASSKRASYIVNDRADDKSPIEGAAATSVRHGHDSPKSKRSPESNGVTVGAPVNGAAPNAPEPEVFYNPVLRGSGDVSAAADDAERMCLIKVEYGDDVVKLRLLSESGLSYRAVLSAAKERFRMAKETRVRLKYQDTDGEWILLSDDEDVREAWCHNDRGTRSGQLRLRMSDHAQIGDC